MRHGPQKSAPKVRNGQVCKKNCPELSGSYYRNAQPHIVVDRKHSGKGFRHVLTQNDVHRFIGLLPDWEELSQGLNAIVLAPGEEDTDGYHTRGVVHICAWEEDRWIEYERDTEFFRNHAPIFERLGVPILFLEGCYAQCQFTEETARAYQLLHILLHELGHHHDRMTTRLRKYAGRGEPYTESYALRYEARIWQRYHDAFA